MGFGLAPAGFACALASPSKAGMGGWLFGAALSLIGALGVFGLQNGAALLIAWETMSLGGAVMVLSEQLETSRGRTILFMLALLEVGSVALLVAVAILGLGASSLDIGRFAARVSGESSAIQVGVGLLLLAGFGAKLGLLPFYEWFPGAYGSGSGASGAIVSGVVLNAAFFGLARGLIEWLPGAPDGAFPLLSVIVIVVATVSAILTILYAFQQDDWRRLLSLSSAENASIAVVALGAAMLFRSCRLQELAGLAWTVALLHLAGHALAKGTLFLTRGWHPSPDGNLRHHRQRRRREPAVRRREFACSDESCGDAPYSWLRQRMVRLPVRVSGLPSSRPQRSAGSRAHGGRSGADGCGRIRDIRKAHRHQRPRT